jgi:hypothetical protein
MDSLCKTLIGKDHYLFLINDSSKSLDNHVNITIDDLKGKQISNYNIYNKYFDKFLLIIFPDKEVICNKFLPDDVSIINRAYLEIYKDFFDKNIIDNQDILDCSDYYKTDSHINTKGVLKVINKFFTELNTRFNVNILTDLFSVKETTVPSLMSLNKGLGDLTWVSNKKDIMLEDITEIYYSINEIEDLYMEIYNNGIDGYQIFDYELKDISINFKGEKIDWQCVSNGILYKKNTDFIINKKCLIFYDSFLLHGLNLIKNIFSEIYLVKNNPVNKLIDLINPELITVFRVERFLSA